MYRQKLCVDLGVGMELSLEEQIPLIAESGFEGMFTAYWRRDRMLAISNLCKRYDLTLDAVHAPFADVKKVWVSGEDGDVFTDYMIRALQTSADIGVRTFVCHAFKGYESELRPSELGIERFSRLIRKGDELGVRIAFENTEGEEFLYAVMDAFKDEKNVGFCWNSGHELCYNRGKDMLSRYKDKLFCAHLNDNLGISDFDGNVDRQDDLHLMPFDGISDWEEIARRLAETGFGGMLTFELRRANRTNRHDHDMYQRISEEEYVATAYNRACRVATLFKKYKK